MVVEREHRHLKHFVEDQHFYERPYISYLTSRSNHHHVYVSALHKFRHHPFSCSTPRDKNHHALGTTTPRSTKKRQKHCETERRSNSENSEQVCVTLWNPDVLGRDWRDNRVVQMLVSPITDE